MKQNFSEQPITDTLEKNYMPYAMSVIISRAIPDIDGFKPSHRKLLYTMYKMGLLTGNRTKSANVVGQTMKLNPHGDATIYETMVRLSRGYAALLHPYVDSKGNFGKQYSRDMAYAAARYTEVRLDPIAHELFADIDKNTVEFTDNYDGTMKEPPLLPVTFPAVLVNANQGIAVGMASSICSFNLAEVCETAIALINDPDHPIAATLKAPDFSTGGAVIYSQRDMQSIFETGRGSFKLRAVWEYNKKENCIEITEIPYTTTIEAIVEKIVDLYKQGKMREISDIRDESDLGGLKITIDLKRGVDPDKLMDRLYRVTPLQDSFSCNFNILIAGTPRVMGVGEILGEWTAFRTECLRRELHFDISKMRDKLHLLRGLRLILLDIDKAVEIVRNTENESEVEPNLMIGFGVDEVQAAYIAEIKLRHLNREHVLKRLEEVDELVAEIARLEDIFKSPAKIRGLIVAQLKAIMKKYSAPRKTRIVYEDELRAFDEEEHIDDYPVNIFMTREGYFKKITPQSLRMSGEHKLKEGDAITVTAQASNKWELVVLTDRQQAYKARLYDFEDGKSSVLGDYLPSKLGMEQGEAVIFSFATLDYEGCLLLFFADGRAAKIPLESYRTKLNRRKLTGAFSGKAPVVAAFHILEERDFVLESSKGRLLIANSGAIPPKSTRTTQGVMAMTLKAGATLFGVTPLEGQFSSPDRYRTKSLPAAGRFIAPEDEKREQITLE